MVEALVERARTPLDSGQVNLEVVRVLAGDDLSRRDRGQLLIAQLVLLQGSLSATEAAAQAAVAVETLRQSADVDALLSALAIGAMISAAAGDRAACLDMCLDMSGIMRSNPGAAMSYRSAGNFGAALNVLGAYELAAPLFVNAIEHSRGDKNMMGLVASCVNLAITVSRQALVAGHTIVTNPVSVAQLQVIDTALRRIQSSDLGQEMRAFVTAVLTNCAQLRGDMAGADALWADLDALTAHPSPSFTQYLCLIEAPLAVHRGDVARAHTLIEATLEYLPTPHIVPLGRVDALKLRSRLHEQTGDVAAALEDARDAADIALQGTSGFADLLIAQIDKRAALEHSQRALLDQADHLTEQALIDELAQIGNRRAYESRIEELQMAPASTVAVLWCDIDGFKRINDQFGHAVGDDVLVRAAEILSERCPRTDDAFRYGGDEFVLLLDKTSRQVASLLAKDVRRAFGVEPWLINGNPVEISCSIGVWTGPSSNLQYGLAEADRQLYEAKKAGRNTVRVTSDAETQHPQP